MNLDDYPLVSDWLRLTDGQLVLRTGKVDIGQRITTALIRIVAEELTLEPSTLRLDPVRTGVSPDEGMTSGSTSVVQSGGALRLAAATLRDCALRLAAAQIAGDAGDLVLDAGHITHAATDRRFALLDLLADCDPDLPVDRDAAPLSRKGRAPLPASVPRGLPEMVRGAFEFIHDMERPGMLHARTVRPPRPTDRLKGIDPETCSVLEDRGLELIRDGSFLAVAGPSEWAVIQGALRLARGCEWAKGPDLPEGDFVQMLLENPRTSVPLEDGVPQDAPVPPPLDAPDLTATFARPYQLHGAMGPSAALAHWRDGKLEIHSHSQGIYTLRQAIADSLQMDLDDVQIFHGVGAGCYGHNAADDAAYEASLVARALPDRPILLKWTRDDEHGWEPVSPAMVVQVAAKLDGDRVAAYSAEAFSDTHRGRPRPGPDRAGPRRLLANRFRADPDAPFVATPNMGRHAGLHRNLDPLYSFGEVRAVKNLVHDLPLRSSAMRCLGAVVNTFAHEAFMDELAEMAGRDPLEFRRDHLQDDPRAVAVLDRLAQHLADTPPQDDTARGIAFAQYKNQMTRVAVAVDLQVTEAAEPVLERITIVADAGRIVDPDGLRDQLEGGALQGASWALIEQLGWDRDGVTTRDWDSYPVIRFKQVPQIQTILIDRPDAPSVGAGEASPGPVVGAIANALYGATGMRMRRMPFNAERLMEMALAE